MNRIGKIKEEIKKFYGASENTCMRMWFYKNHVLVAAQYTEQLSKDIGGDVEIAVLAALLHDIARA